MLAIVVASLAGFMAGFVDAIAGGGGVITFPTLLMLNLPVSLIVGTNKLISTFGTTMAAFVFWRKGHVNPEILVRALPMTIVGALLGAMLVVRVPNEFLKPVVSTVLILLSIYFYFRPQLGQTNQYKELTSRLAILIAVSCLSIGFYDGFFGPGTGMFLTFLFVKGAKLDFVRAAGNTKILNLASNLIPLIYFLKHGNVVFSIGIPMAIANLAGGYVGAHSAIKVGSKFVRIIFIVMALLLSVKLVLDWSHS